MGYRLGRGARQSPGPNAAPDDDDAKRDYSGLYFKQAGIPGTRLRHVKNSNLLIHNVGTMAQSYVKPDEMLGKVPREDFEKRYQRIVSSSNQFIINHYNVDEQSVNWVLPNYLVISRTIHLLDAQRIYATSLRILDGLTIMQLGDRSLVANMIRTSAANMAQRYGADTAHSTFVTRVACSCLMPCSRFTGLIGMIACF